jgi:hypothetical protein
MCNKTSRSTARLGIGATGPDFGPLFSAWTSSGPLGKGPNPGLKRQCQDCQANLPRGPQNFIEVNPRSNCTTHLFDLNMKVLGSFDWMTRGESWEENTKERDLVLFRTYYCIKFHILNTLPKLICLFKKECCEYQTLALGTPAHISLAANICAGPLILFFRVSENTRAKKTYQRSIIYLMTSASLS